MLYCYSTILSLLLAVEALAVPAPPKRGFRAEAHRLIPKRSLVSRQTGAVEAIDDGGGWILPVLIGGQQVMLNIDTGSSDLWTVSSLMPSSQQSTVARASIYDPSQSSTFQNMNGSTFGIRYADGSGASGPVGTDSVEIGGATVSDMPFGMCSDLQYGSGETSRDTDGPVGLGFGAVNSIRPAPQCTFMECLEPYVPSPVFCTYFRLDDSGFVDFGYVNTSAYSGNITTVLIANTSFGNEGQWVTQGVRFGSGGSAFIAAGPVDMDFDSGTASLSLPAAAAAAYFALIPGSSNSSGLWQYPCGSTLPDFDFFFSQVINGPSWVSIPGRALMNGSADSGMCSTWIYVVTGRANAGLPFYITNYIMWDQATPSLAFAAQA